MSPVRAFCACVYTQQHFTESYAAEVFTEMRSLASTAGVEITNDSPWYIKLREINPKTYISSGLLDKLSGAITDAGAVDCILFNMDFSPTQQRNLAKHFNKKILSKSDLIFEIFMKRATTAPSKIQIELANLKYLRTRLTGSYEGFDRIRGGIGIKGPGETKLEIDRRAISKRIHKLTKDLKEYAAHTKLLIKRREALPSVSLVGYTNAGKTTLLNRLTKGSQKAEDLLFSTVDVKSKKMYVSPGLSVVVSDTIGFIRDLPAHLIESFKTTLLEISYSKLICIVVDYTSPYYMEHIDIVRAMLDTLGCTDIPTVTVYNKVDNIPGFTPPESSGPAFYLSAETGTGVDKLVAHIGTFFSTIYTTAAPKREL